VNKVCELCFNLGHLLHMTPEQMQAYTLQRELDDRNRPMTDDELESLLPPGYKVVIIDFATYYILENASLWSINTPSILLGLLILCSLGSVCDMPPRVHIFPIIHIFFQVPILFLFSAKCYYFSYFSHYIKIQITLKTKRLLFSCTS